MFACLLPEKKKCKLVPLTSFARWVTLGSRGVVSKTKTEARSTQNSKTKHLNLENEAPIENEAPKTRNHCRLNNCNFTSSMGEAPREKNNVLSPSWEPYQTVSAVYFILGILRTDLWSQSSADLSPVRKKKKATKPCETRIAKRLSVFLEERVAADTQATRLVRDHCVT